MDEQERLTAFRRAALRRAEEQGFIRLVGARIDEVGEGRCLASVGFRAELTQLHGFFHGGVLAFLCDYTCAVAAASLIPDPSTQSVLTAEFKLNFLSPAIGPRLLSRAEVVRAGRTLSVVEARLYNSPEDGADDGAAPKLVGIGLASIATVAIPRAAPR